jgi:tetratricopeptide (TPR) repeat protein
MHRKISRTAAVLSAAVRALDHGKVDLAEHNFTATLRSQPKNVLALAGLGLVNARKNKRKEALKYFARALEFAPHSRDLVQEILQATRGRDRNQLRDLEHLAEIRPNSTALLLALIELQLQAGRKAKADRWYERLVKIQPKVAEGWINRGLGRNMRNDGKGARREFDRAAKLEPANVEIYQLRGDLYLEAKDYESALADFRRVARLARRSSLGFRRCGDVYSAKGDYSRAIKMYLQALKRNPQDTDAHLGIAGACESLNDYGRAFKHYRRVVQLTPKSAFAHGLLGQAYERAYRGKPEFAKAEREYRQAFKLDRKDRRACYALGDLYLNWKKYKEAQTVFKKLLEADRNDTRARYGLGDLYLAWGKHTDAQKVFTEILKTDPNDARSHYGLGLAYEGQNQLPKALRHYQRVCQLNVGNLDALVKCGNIHLALGERDAALADYDRVVKLAPRLADGYGLRGSVYQEQKKFGKAEKQYRRAIQLAPTDTRGHYALGDLYLAWSKYKDAEKVFRQVLKMSPSDARSNYGLGLAYEGQHDFKDALKHYRRLAELEPRDADARKKCGDMQLALDRSGKDRFRQALREFRQVQRLAPKSSVGFRRSGDAYRSHGELPEALTLYKQAIERDPRDAEAHYGIALTYEGQNNFQEALRHYDKVVELAPNAPEGYYRRGLIYEEKRDYSRALREYEQALKLTPEEPALLVARGRIHYYMDQYESARQDLDITLKRNPTDVTALHLRGLVFESLGSDGKHDYYESYKSALKDYEELVRLAPREADAHTRHASALVALSAYDRAVEAYNRALELDGKNAQTWADKADCLRLWSDLIEVEEKLTEACAAADGALKLDPGHAMAQAVRGAISTQLRRYDAALSSLNAALETAPNYHWARKERGKALYFRGDIEKALDAFTELAGENTGFESLGLAGQILTLRKLSRPDEADKALEKSLGNPPRDPNACMSLGRSFVEFKQFSEAAANFRQAIRLNPGLPDAHNEFAWYQTKLEKNDELVARCIDHAELAVALSPERAIKGNYLDTLGWLWYLRGDFKKARRHLRQAIKLTEPDVLIRHHLAVVEQQLDTGKASLAA